MINFRSIVTARCTSQFCLLPESIVSVKYCAYPERNATFFSGVSNDTLPQVFGPRQASIQFIDRCQINGSIFSLEFLQHRNEVIKVPERIQMIRFCSLYNGIDTSACFRSSFRIEKQPVLSSDCERAIRPFTLGRKNFVIIDTSKGAQASAILYSLVETAKANHLNPYKYFELLLTELPNHAEDEDPSYLDDLLPWSKRIQKNCLSQINRPKKS